jgi:hypothetical protein
MNALAGELRAIVEHAAPRLHGAHEPRVVSPGLDGQWSARQLLGHLIDSASNNHSRFVRAQFVEDLAFPGYDQEQWVAVQHYDDESWPALVELWRLYNLHLAHIIEAISEDQLLRPRSPHTLDKISWQPVEAGEPATLATLIGDYIGHLQHHLGQLLAMER